ncbi:hypothetical protein HanRHA438_Chr14g0643481 [Helianthus annuus]|nr:hypothetical protein HanIR_Chr14g0686541 [Helianthus annuus]KAJ0852768.1 hypothetical protein HanRHA438_Chr14g0643481 [Helianthus annuus]
MMMKERKNKLVVHFIFFLVFLVVNRIFGSTIRAVQAIPNPSFTFFNNKFHPSLFHSPLTSSGFIIIPYQITVITVMI